METNFCRTPSLSTSTVCRHRMNLASCPHRRSGSDIETKIELLKALVDRAPEKAVNRANGNKFADKNIIAAVSGRNVVFDVIPKNIQASKITI